MRNILVIGAGRSSSELIKYLLNKAVTEDLFVVVADISLENAQERTNNHPQAKAIKFDVFDATQRQEEIQKANIVISMLPARFHMEVANDCLTFGKHMVTASYVSKEMKALDTAVQLGCQLMQAGIDRIQAGIPVDSGFAFAQQVQVRAV